MDTAHLATNESFVPNGEHVFQNNSNESYCDKSNKNLRKEALSLHPIVESCLHERNGGGNLWSGGLCASVFLRIKLSEQQHRSRFDSDIVNDYWLRSALEILQESCQQEESEATCRPMINIGDCQNEKESSHYLSLYSNAFIASRCLLTSLLQRLGQKGEAYEIATAVLAELSDLAGKSMDTENSNTNDKYTRDCSVLFGLAGGLQVIWFLRKELGEPTLGKDIALELGFMIFLEGLQEQEQPVDEDIEMEGGNETTKRFRLEWKWNGWPYLGAGTGCIGILYALLGYTEEEWEDLEETVPSAKSLVKKAIDELASHRYVMHSSFSGRGNLKDASTDYEPDESLSACDWTHGAPGYCLLLLKAFDVYGDERCFFHAQDLAESVVWSRWQHQAYNKSSSQGLAKGVSGIAYVFLAMARVDWRDRGVWIKRARELATIAISDVSDETTCLHHPKSLFDGIGGLASLLIDLEGDLDCSIPSYFPFFESCQANLNNPRKLEYKTRPGDHIFMVQHTQNETQNGKQTRADARNSSIKSKSKSPGMSKAGKSSAETAITQALTHSMTTQIPTIIGNNSSSNEDYITSALDVSQLTEPSANQAFPQCSPGETHTPIAPIILEIREAATKSIFSTHGNVANVSPKLSSKKRKYPKSLTKRSTFSCSNLDGDNDIAFITDSIKRIQRAEASWILHFGTQHEKEQRKVVGRRRFSSPGNCAKTFTKSSFGRSVGALSGLSGGV